MHMASRRCPLRPKIPSSPNPWHWWFATYKLVLMRRIWIRFAVPVLVMILLAVVLLAVGQPQNDRIAIVKAALKAMAESNQDDLGLHHDQHQA